MLRQLVVKESHECRPTFEQIEQFWIHSPTRTRCPTVRIWEVYALLPPLLFRLGGVHLSRRFIVLIDAVGPRLVRLNYYNQMCERCPRT